MADPSGLLREYFENVSEDWTNVLGNGKAVVQFCRYADDPSVTELCKSVLSNSELKRADQFTSLMLSNHFIQRRAFQRFFACTKLSIPGAFSDLHFDGTKKGRPFLKTKPACSFSFSACESAFIAALSDTHHVGIDIENTAQKMEIMDMAKSFFDPAEVRQLEQIHDSDSRRTSFFKLWSLKEAALKSVGEGLPMGIDGFQFNLAPKVRMVDSPSSENHIRNFECHLHCVPNSVAALVLKDAVSALT